MIFFSKKDGSPKNRITTTTTTSSGKMMPNSNVKQIFVKSPPPPVQTPTPSPMLSSPSSQTQLQHSSSSVNTIRDESNSSSPTIVQPTGANQSRNLMETSTEGLSGGDSTTTINAAVTDSTSTNEIDASANLKSLLDAREAHVLKLNKQNVELQEENDNLLNEIEKV